MPKIIAKKPAQAAPPTMEHRELRTKGRTRGIRVCVRDGGPGIARDYWFRENPHDSPAYNQDQPRFYQDVANQILDSYVRSGGDAAHRHLPEYGETVTYDGILYHLDR